MISLKTLKAIEYDKIMQAVSEYAVLNGTKTAIADFMPVSDYKEAKLLQDKTKEAYDLIYTYNVGSIFFFDDVTDELKRAEAGGTLNTAELLKIASNLKSARMLKTSVDNVKDDNIKLIPEIVSRIFTNYEYEKEIASKIIAVDEISDNASPKLASIRRSIKNIQVRIRDRLNSYMRGSFGKYLQDSVVTMRQDRYVIPVKSEYRSFVKGFIHDQSSTGSTVFIEPEEIMELNNDLKRAGFDEAEEIHRILSDLSVKVTFMADGIRYNADNISEVDSFFARAEYSFKNKCVRPVLNDKGYIVIDKGRHPLIDAKKVVPVSLTLGKDYRFLLITGPNTGGKTVTLKLTGLFSAMAMSGLFLPALNVEISVFNDIFCDIGDEQSIEQNLSTFSSHITNIINIVNGITDRSLVLLDEIGAGTDPEEGSALALAIINKLLEKNACGIITTHYSRLKEFAFKDNRIENASMEFDVKTLRPLYRLNIGMPGSSNAIDIAKTLGLDKGVINSAISFLSDKQISFENVLKKAEESRREAEESRIELEKLKEEQLEKLKIIEEEKQKITVEREKIYNNARQETKRIVADKLSEAEEIIDELKSILKRAGLESKEIFRAGELKNRLKNSKYLTVDSDEPFELKKIDLSKIKTGMKVYAKSLGTFVTFISLKKNKTEAEISFGNVKSIVKTDDLYNEKPNDEIQKEVKIFRNTTGVQKSEINVLGKTTLEGVEEVKNFIDGAIVAGYEEVKIIHGVGSGALLKSIREYLKKEKNVVEFRRGKYGEGENGVTIVRLK